MPAARSAGPSVLTFLLAVLVAACSAAQPRPPEGDAATSRVYLALGDSLAVGVGADAPDESGYVGRLFAWLRDDGRAGALHNLARSGETSGSMVMGGQLTEAVEVVNDRSSDVVVVTLDIGGNDLLRLRSRGECSADPSSERCGQAVLGALRDFRLNYGGAITELRRALDDDPGDERFLVMTYYNPFRRTGSEYEERADQALVGSDLVADCAAGANEAGTGLNDLIVCPADPLGLTIVDTYPLFTDPTALTHISSNDVHANDAGHALIADAFVDAVGSRNPEDR